MLSKLPRLFSRRPRVLSTVKIDVRCDACRGLQDLTFQTESAHRGFFPQDCILAYGPISYYPWIL